MPPVLRGDHPAVRACRELFLPDGASDEEIAAARQAPLGSPSTDADAEGVRRARLRTPDRPGHDPTRRRGSAAPNTAPHQAKDNANRHARQHGRTTAGWKRPKAQAKATAAYRCMDCGRPETPTPQGWLGRPHPPELGGDHHLATLAACIVLCPTCHGASDGARAHPQPLTGKAS